MQQFSENESIALRVYNLPQGTPDDTLLSIIKNESIPIWKSNIEMLNNTLNSELTLENYNFAKKLIKYNELRLETYELIYKSISQKSSSFDMEIELKSREIEKLISEL